MESRDGEVRHLSEHQKDKYHEKNCAKDPCDICQTGIDKMPSVVAACAGYTQKLVELRPLAP